MNYLRDKLDSRLLYTTLFTTVVVWLATTIYKPFEPQVMRLINSAHSGIDDEYLITSRGMGLVSIGMKADDLYRWATERNYRSKSYNSSSIGCFGSSTEIYNGNEKLAYIEFDHNNLIEKIHVFSEMYKTASGVGCGMRLGDVSRMYNDLELFQGGPYDDEYMILDDLELVLYYKHVSFENGESAGGGWKQYESVTPGALYATRVNEKMKIKCIRICTIPCKYGYTHLDKWDEEEAELDESTDL